MDQSSSSDYYNELDCQVQKLVSLVETNNAPMDIQQAHLYAAGALGVSYASVPFVGNTAVARGLLVLNARKHTYAVPKKAVAQ